MAVSERLGASPEVERTYALAARLREHEDGPDLLVLTNPVNLRYITGFTGTNGLALIAAAEGAPKLFFTDFRYETQSAAQVPELLRAPDLHDRPGGGARQGALPERGVHRGGC